MRLFNAILLLMLVVSLVPTLIVGTASISDTRELLVRDAQELAQERLEQIRLKTENLLEDPTRATMSLARIPGFFSLPLAEQRAQIAAVLNQRREVLAITVFDASGQRLKGLQAFAVNDISPSEVAAHEARAAKLLSLGTAGALRYSDVTVHPSTGQPVVTVAFSVGDPVRGAVAADLALGDLQTMLSQEPVGSSGFAYVVDARGRLVAGSPALGEVKTGADVSARAPVAHLLGSASNGGDHSHVGNFGAEGSGRVVAAYAELRDLGWAVVSEQPMGAAYAQVSAMERRLWLSVLGALLVAAALAWLFSRNLTRGLKGFVAGALELAHGKFGVQVKAESSNEIGELAKTFNYMSQQLQAYDHETRGLYENLENGYLETLVALANAIDSKDPYTRGHSQRVGDLAVEIGLEMGLPPRDIRSLQYGGILHDIGKIGIIDAILGKQSKLTDDEMGVMRGHPDIGDQIVEPVRFLAPIRACIRSHHERWDGTGYPDKMKGEAIPMLARIVACSDTFDACTSTRPYQKAMPLEKAMEIMENLRGKALDPNVVDALRRVVQKKGVRVEGRADPVRLAS